MIKVLAIGIALTFASAGTHAQTYPEKPVRLVVGFAAGGPVDNLARLVSRRLSELLGQQFVVDNRAGASGMIGAQAVAHSAPDGYTLLMVPSTHAVNPSLYKSKMAFDTERDFTPVSLVAEGPFVLVVPAKLPVKSVAELVAYAKKQPQPLSYASAGVGGLPHLAAELFKTATGIQATHIPYKGAAPATVDLLAGQVSFMFDNMLSAIPSVRDARLRALAVTTAKRSAALPDVPTMQEAGFKDYEVSGWYALLGPAGMDAGVVNKLNSTVNRILREPDVIKKLQIDGVEAQGSTPQALEALIHRDIAKWAAVVKASGATAD
ncbi:MAG TPA: tripartite tricarboxylate transporter substrate binding protein [Burkholderiales bacterium]